MSTSMYAKIARIGEGAYGVVYKARDRETNEIVALKRIRLKNDEEGVPCTAIREIGALMELRHPNLVHLHKVLHSENKLTLVFEFLDMDLRKFLDTHRDAMTPAVLRSFIQQLLRGAAYCHSRSMLHRDLKPQNLLIQSEQMVLKLADFGLGRAFGIPVAQFTHEVVTLWYRAPDVLLGNTSYGTAVDMWAIGCIILEMVTGVPLFPGKNDFDQLLKICAFLGSPTPQNWPSMMSYPNSANTLSKEEFTDARQPECEAYYTQPAFAKFGPDGIDLLKRMLLYEPAERITAAQALEHAYFTSTREFPNA
ncbi:cell division protein kinase [Perkinsela sp. CCAP 1560/4]|nr:cell division protein kinase [Perkinsela sp. CCAP 1560/4]|eukprot:KNH06445.1 cell division protein kinase [Perkinsela sp. CCAP 1560/4]